MEKTILAMRSCEMTVIKEMRRLGCDRTTVDALLSYAGERYGDKAGTSMADSAVLYGTAPR